MTSRAIQAALGLRRHEDVAPAVFLQREIRNVEIEAPVRQRRIADLGIAAVPAAAFRASKRMRLLRVVAIVAIGKECGNGRGRLEELGAKKTKAR